MKTFYMMRHGQTLFNLRHKIQGWCDSPLTPLGIRQAQAAAEYFDGVPLDHLYSSTAERCCDTAELVTRGKMPYTRLKGLKEKNFGVFEGESEDLHPAFEAMDTHYVQFGGESNAQCRARVVAACQEIMAKPDHQVVLAVSHAGACFNFLGQWVPQEKVMEMRRQFTNCSIFRYDYEDGQFFFREVITVPVKEEG